MSDDVIWALDQRERCIACPSKPVVNAVILYLPPDGDLPKADVARWATTGVMAAGVLWPGMPNNQASAVNGTTPGHPEKLQDLGLDSDTWLDLEDAVFGLQGLAQAVAIIVPQAAKTLGDNLAARTGVCCFVEAKTEGDGVSYPHTTDILENLRVLTATPDIETTNEAPTSD